MKDAMGREMYQPRPGVDYCGYCKSDYDAAGNCRCDGRGHRPDYAGTCGYCHEEYAIGAGTDCNCDGFGGDKETHEKACRYCGGKAIGNWCYEDGCGMAQ